MERAEVFDRLHRYVSKDLLGGDGEDLDGSTLLLQTGILDSMSMVDLIAFVERSFGFQIPDAMVEPKHFGTLDALTDLVTSLQAGAGAGTKTS